METLNSRDCQATEGAAKSAAKSAAKAAAQAPCCRLYSLAGGSVQTGQQEAVLSTAVAAMTQHNLKAALAS